MSWPSVSSVPSTRSSITCRGWNEPTRIASDAAMSIATRSRSRRFAPALPDGLVPSGHRVPVDDVPPSRQVVGAPVLVVEVVGILPDVDAEERRLAVHDRCVLVRGGLGCEPRSVPDEPRPAGAEALDAGVVDGCLELVEAPERRSDRVAERTGRLSAAARPHDLPEERVIGMPASVVANRHALVLGEGVEIREH